MSNVCQKFLWSATVLQLMTVQLWKLLFLSSYANTYIFLSLFLYRANNIEISWQHFEIMLKPNYQYIYITFSSPDPKVKAFPNKICPLSVAQNSSHFSHFYAFQNHWANLIKTKHKASSSDVGSNRTNEWVCALF